MAGGWSSLGLMPELVDAAEVDFDWILPTAVQDECIPLILGGGDVLASAETGSGKTAAFALPILQLCHEHRSAKARGSTANPVEAAGNQMSKPPLRYEMSVNDRDKLISIDPNSDGCLVQSRDVKEWSGCRCTAGVTPNSVGTKFYFECTVRDEGIVRVGFATADASLNLGTDDGGYGYGGTGMKAHRGKFDPFVREGDGEKISFGKGDVIGCLLDFGTGDQKGGIAFSKNGGMIGKAFDLPNSSGGKGSKKETLCLYPAVSLKNAECQMNFGGPGSSTFQYPPFPNEEYRPIASATLESGGVENPRTNFPRQGPTRTMKHVEGPLAIVIEPTRDLAEQTYRVFDDLARHLSKPKIEAALLVGGLSPQRTLTQLARNNVDVLVGTPPIVASYVKQGKIKTSQCNMFLLDEADQLVSKDSLEHINLIFSRLPKGGQTHSAFDRLQVCFFSATLHSREVKDLTAKICHRPLWVDLRGKNDSIIPETVHHCVVDVDPLSYASLDTKEDLMQTDGVHRGGKLDAKTDWSQLSPEEINSERIKLMKPHVMLDLLDKFDMDQVLVFARTNLDCDLLEKFLRRAGGDNYADKAKYSCRVLAGMRSMQERQANLKAFQQGEVRVLIATDVAARGLDIRELPFVINMMLPDEPQTYVHRIGRVGRAERIGLAISIVATSAKEYVWYCQSGKKPPCADTRLYDKGGNCKWYSEKKLLKQIEMLLKKNKVNITRLQWPEMNVPAEMAALVKGKGYGDYACGESIDPNLKAHLEELSSTVNALGVTEFALQSGYWKLKDKLSGCVK